MAVAPQKPVPSKAGISTGRRVLTGTNVTVAIVLAVGIVVFAQMMAFRSGLTWDMTSTGVNSLSPATESLLRGLEQPIRLVSLYFETDRELPEQKLYRKKAQDLVKRFESVNRAELIAEWINPLKNHEQLQAMLARLAEKPKFQEGIANYVERIDAYRDGLDGQVQELIQSELTLVSSLGASIGQSGGSGAIANIENLLMQWTDKLRRVREAVDTAMLAESPQYAPAVDELRNTYATFEDTLNSIIAYGKQELARDASLPGSQTEFLSQAATRYAPVLAAVEAEQARLDELDPLEFDKLVQQIGPRGLTNPIVVETEESARVVEFGTIWPALDPAEEGRPNLPFQRRAFKGEEKLTAAILRVTNKEQTAVVFVRFGGPALFFGNPMQGARAPYRQMKQHLEDANFIVAEWDLATGDTQPEIDPVPTRTIFVVLQPNPPAQQMPGMPPSGQMFGPRNLEAFKEAFADAKRALFIAGWQQGPAGTSAKYEYRQYLRNTWGIGVKTAALLIETASTSPGQYNVLRRDFHSLNDLELSEHDIVRNVGMQRLALPSCAALDTMQKKDAVDYTTLVTQPAKDGVWGVYNLQAYGDQVVEHGYMTKIKTDEEGPFVLAMAATREADDEEGAKGDEEEENEEKTEYEKIVVVSSRGFAVDANAFAMAMVRTGSGIGIRHANPGNVALFINSLHWLNDNTEFMNIGKPIDAAVLRVERSTVKKVQALTIFVWPLLALCCGIIAWRVRRR